MRTIQMKVFFEYIIWTNSMTICIPFFNLWSSQVEENIIDLIFFFTFEETEFSLVAYQKENPLLNHNFILYKCQQIVSALPIRNVGCPKQVAGTTPL